MPIQMSCRPRQVIGGRMLAIVAAILLLCSAGAARAQEIVRFPSSDDNGPGQPPTMLDAHLFRPPGGGPYPALVGLHGCSGMFNRTTGGLTGLYRAWGAEFAAQGYALLLVDSLGPRQKGEMCSIQGFDIGIYRKRPHDAYGALLYLQQLPFVRADRVGLVGWSQGGGVTLFVIGPQRLGRPASLPAGDFRAAAAFYPGSCNERRHPGPWTAAVPLLVLMGTEDVWTPLAPCREFLDAAIGRGSRIEMVVYPGAYHGFDAPNNARRELPAYVTRGGVVPIVGTDPAARADSLARVPAFFADYLKN